MANPEHLEILKQGVDVWNNWRREYFRHRWEPCVTDPGRRPDLSFANLEGLDLRRVDLRSVNLANVSLRDSDLRHARLGGACLMHANLQADLRIANFRSADLELAGPTSVEPASVAVILPRRASPTRSSDLMT